MRYLLTAATAHAERGSYTLCGTPAYRTATGPEGRKLCGRCVKIVEKGYIPAPTCGGGPFGWDLIEGVAPLVNAFWGAHQHERLLSNAERAEVEALCLSAYHRITPGTLHQARHDSDAALLAWADRLTRP